MGVSSFIPIGGERLYSVLEPSAGDFMADYAVLMCYPFGDEYMGSHRVFCHLAKLLARKGVVCMRFDYSCTGDSSGEAVDFSLEAARHEIRFMVKELSDLAGVSDVRVIGFRLGATLIYECLGDIDAVKRIACWDPIINGRQYLEELRGTIVPGKEGDYIIDGTWWVHGFPIGSHLRSEINSIDLLNADCDTSSRILFLSSTHNTHVDQLRNRCGSLHRAFTCEIIKDDNDEGSIRDAWGIFRFPKRTFPVLIEWLTT